jgi:hypothetical protein
MRIGGFNYSTCNQFEVKPSNDLVNICCNEDHVLILQLMGSGQGRCHFRFGKVEPRNELVMKSSTQRDLSLFQLHLSIPRHPGTSALNLETRHISFLQLSSPRFWD